MKKSTTSNGLKRFIQIEGIGANNEYKRANQNVSKDGRERVSWFYYTGWRG